MNIEELFQESQDLRAGWDTVSAIYSNLSVSSPEERRSFFSEGSVWIHTNQNQGSSRWRFGGNLFYLASFFREGISVLEPEFPVWANQANTQAEAQLVNYIRETLRAAKRSQRFKAAY